MADGCELVVGADGQIGRALLARLAADGRPAVGTSRRPGGAGRPLDLAADPASWELPGRVSVAYLCAAVTSVEACRRDPAGTAAVNVTRTLDLADRLRGRGAHLVFLSTNQVFDGAVPFRREDEPPRPRTEYGRQKAAVERELLAAGGATVVRLTKVVPADWPLVRGWAEVLARGEPVEAFRDMVLAPVPLDFVTRVLARVGEARPGGVFHVSGAADLTYADLARRVAARVGAAAGLVRETSFADKGLPPEAAPAHTALDAARLRDVLGLTAPAFPATLDPPAGRAA
ncbi:MAG: sugar nucleotide-binding protein [Gemmataceae bacterium]|nr:sugar nucleotide-binding protein [Gemmataceae bacterium]